MPDEWFAYLRKSKGRTGISRQRVITTAHLARKGGKVRAEYIDTDSTAYALPGQPPPPRKDFARLLADLSRNPGIGIAAWHADRILRNPEETETLIRACLAGGHLIETARGGTYDVSNANGRKRLRDDANDAAAEVDHNRERILAMKAEQAADGRWNGGPRPFGFRVDNDAPGGLVPDAREAALARAACEGILAGTATLYSIAPEWHDAGATGTKGGYLSAVNIRKILIAPRSAGLMTDGSPASWPAIIPEPRWRALCAVLGDESRRKGPGPQRSHLLTGIGLCGECGCPVIAAPGDRGPRYRCSAVTRQLPGRREGRHITAHLEQADAFAAALAVGRMKLPDAALLLRADHSAERGGLLDADAAQQALYDEQWHLYRAKAINARELSQGRGEIDAERAGIRARLDALDEADALAPFLADPEGAWETAPLHQRRGLVAGLMHMTFFHARRGRPRTGSSVPYFDVDAIDVRWRRRLPSDG